MSEINAQTSPVSIEQKTQAEIRDVGSQIDNLRAEMKPIQQAISRLEVRLGDATTRLESARKKPRVSDHAVIRFLERVHGFCLRRTTQSAHDARR